MPKHEWNVAAGVALINANAQAVLVGGMASVFNLIGRRRSGLIASNESLVREVLELVSDGSRRSS